MAENTIKRAKEKAAQLQEMQVKPSMSDVFTQALVGFLPLIAGIGSSEDVAALAPVGMEGVKTVADVQSKERAATNALNMKALEMVGEEEAAAAKGAERERALKEKKELIEYRSKVAETAPMSPFQERSLALRQKELEQMSAMEERRLRGQEFREEDSERGRKERFIKTFNSDKLVQKYQEGLDAAKNVQVLLAQNSPLTEPFAKRQLARLSGEVGVLTDKDVEAFGGSRALLDRAKQAITSAASGKFTPENKKLIEETVALLSKVKQSQLENRTKLISEQLGQVDLGAEKVRGLVQPSVVPSAKPVITKQQAMEELARRRANK